MATGTETATKKDDIIVRIPETQGKRKTKVIEWNINMEVTISYAKKFKIFQRTQSLVLLILAVAIVFAMALSNLKREVHSLQLQMNCMNTNLLMLMFRYDKINRHLNRVIFRPPYNDLSNKKKPRNSILEDENLSKLLPTLELTENLLNDESERAAKKFVPFSNVPGEEARSNNLEKKRERVIGSNKEMVEYKSDIYGDKFQKGKERMKRAILLLDKRNTTAVEPVIIASEMQRESKSKSDGDWDNQSDVRNGRARRDEGRGKKWRKSKKRTPKRGGRRLGPLIATFVGAIPEQHVTDSVFIGPWVKSMKNDSQYSFSKFHLVEDKKSIEVTMTGLYMISAQIFYFGEPSHYSYWILLSSEGTSTTRRITKCATASVSTAAEASCFTSVVLPLRRGDRLHLQQQERDRLINLREGHSYLQLVLLSGTKKRSL